MSRNGLESGFCESRGLVPQRLTGFGTKLGFRAELLRDLSQNHEPDCGSVRLLQVLRASSLRRNGYAPKNNAARLVLE